MARQRISSPASTHEEAHDGLDPSILPQLADCVLALVDHKVDDKQGASTQAHYHGQEARQALRVQPDEEHAVLLLQAYDL